jgi:MOSC domain-containing protein YiiM/alkylated DNA nucleotide flippase Atl1
VAPAGEVVAVFRKPRKGRPVVPADALDVRPGHGIEGDANAAPDSPRQVLLVAAEAEAAVGLAPGALWENVTTRGFDLDGLPSGTLLRLGPSAVVAVTYACEPCTVIRDATGVPLVALTGRRGMVAVVRTGGRVRAGDAVEILPARLPPLPAGYLDRCRAVVAVIPPGEVLTYAGLVTAVGGPSRLRSSLPAWLPGLADEGLPAHRVVPSTDAPLDPVQLARLEAEGVRTRAGEVAQAPFRPQAHEWLHGPSTTTESQPAGPGATLATPPAGPPAGGRD